jgi:type II secretory pathway predicted ATPase ExeA
MGSVAPDGSRSARNKFSDSLYLGGPYADAMAFLCSPAPAPRNIKVLVSESGLGKSVLLHAALSKWGAQARSTYVCGTNFEAAEFIAYLLKEMGSREATPRDLAAAKQQFEALLKSNPQVGKGFVLAIDDAQNLSPAALEHLGALLDCEGARGQQLLLFLAGLPELQYHLADPRAKKLRERISGVMTLDPLSAQQKHAYIRQRWGDAALDLTPEMPAAVDRTEGIPRLLDQLFDRDVVSETARLSILRFDRAAVRTPYLDVPEDPGKLGKLSEAPTVVIETKPSRVEPTTPWHAAAVNVGSPEESAPVIPVPMVIISKPRSRWEQLGWPAIFGIALCLMIPIIWAVFHFTNSSGAQDRTAQDPVARPGEVPTSVNSAPPPPAPQQATHAASVGAPTPVPTSSNFTTPTPSDQALAVESLRIPSQVGDAEAQYKLGIQLASSTTKADLVSAYAWLVMARTGGQPVDDARLHAIAQKLKSKDILDVRYKLGLMYEKGIGCQPDPITADTWYLLAASAGDSRSRSASTRLEAQMAPPQISDARKRAAEWTRNHTPLHP